MQSPIRKRSIIIDGHKTSISLEEAFWTSAKDIAASKDTTLSKLIGMIDNNRDQPNLSSAVRVFVLNYFKSRDATR